MDHFSTPQPQQPAPVATFPSITQLFSESWNNLISKLLPILIFSSITSVLFITFSSIPFSVIVYLSALSSGIYYTLTIIVFILMILIALAFIAIFQIGNILILHGNTLQISYRSLFKQSLSLVVPIVVSYIFIFLIVLGGLTLLVIPGIIFATLLQFVIYLIILDKLSILQAIKRSAYLVSKAFGQIFVRLIILGLIPMVFNMLVGFFSIYLLDETSLILVNAAFAIFYTLFAISSMLTLFKQAKTYAGDGTSQIRTILLVSIIGWVINAGFIFFLITSTPDLFTATELPLTEEPISNVDVVEEYNVDDDIQFNEDLNSPQPSPSTKPSATPRSATQSSTIRN